MTKNNSSTYECATGCGKIMVTFEEEGDKVVLLITASKNGNCIHTRFSDYQHLSNMILDLGGTLQQVIECFDGRICSSHTVFSKSCGDAISVAINQFLKARDNDKPIKT